MAQKPMASDYPLTSSSGLKSYIQDMKSYDIAMGKNPNKITDYIKEKKLEIIYTEKLGAM